MLQITSKVMSNVELIKRKKDSKSQRWMPWLVEAMKDVLDCDKVRGAVKKL